MPEIKIIFVFAVGVSLAFVNGANDVSKGIATLIGAGVADYRRAIMWGTVWTGVGALLAMSVAHAMLAAFGSGFLAAQFEPAAGEALAALCGAVMWIGAATALGMPVSTTHALVGAMCGVAAEAHGFAAVDWGALHTRVFLPLLLTPLLAFALTKVVLRTMRVRRNGATAEIGCVCARFDAPMLVSVGAVNTMALPPPGPSFSVKVAPESDCAAEAPDAFRFTLDHLHWVASGATSLARGLNDAPKIVGPCMVVAAMSSRASISGELMFVVVAAGMLMGSFWTGRRVTRVLAEEVTVMDHRAGASANLLAALLVGGGAILGLPMSTTHVASGAIFATGVERGAIDWGIVRRIAVAWTLTLPGAAVLAALLRSILRLV